MAKDIKKFLELMPQAGGDGKLTEKLDEKKIAEGLAGLYGSGAKDVGESVKALAGAIQILGEEPSVRPVYALHALGNHILQKKDAASRKAFIEEVTKLLDQEMPKCKKAFLMEELQWFGGQESVAPLGKFLTDEQFTDVAGMALVTIGGSGAVKMLQDQLPKTQGRATLVTLHSLAALGSVAGESALGVFEKHLNDKDLELRLAAASGLAEIGTVKAANALMKRTKAERPWEGIRLRKYGLVLAEKLESEGKKADGQKLRKYAKQFG